MQAARLLERSPIDYLRFDNASHLRSFAHTDGTYTLNARGMS